jgi:hypothetical protein
MSSGASPVFVNTFFEDRLQDLLSLAHRIEAAFFQADLEYRVVGGLAAYLYIEEAAPDVGRLTRDIDITVRREDLDRIARAVEPLGLAYRQVAGVHMLVQADKPSARRAVHLVFTGEKVRPHYVEATPELTPATVLNGIRLIPIADLVRMKLTSFRLKDQTHIKDLDEAGVITPEIESTLSAILLDRLKQVRAHE